MRLKCLSLVFVLSCIRLSAQAPLYQTSNKFQEEKIYMRNAAGKVVEAPVQEQNLVRTYPEFASKGPVHEKQRLSIMSAKARIRTGDTLSVVHVYEALDTGLIVSVLGPKKPMGVFINDSLVSRAYMEGDDPFVYGIYEGFVVKSPAIDYNFDIPRYVFTKPGVYRIQWRLGKLVSNELVITVE